MNSVGCAHTCTFSLGFFLAAWPGTKGNPSEPSSAHLENGTNKADLRSSGADDEGSHIYCAGGAHSSEPFGTPFPSC